MSLPSSTASEPGVDWDKNSPLAFSVQTSPLHYQHWWDEFTMQLVSSQIETKVYFLVEDFHIDDFNFKHLHFF